MKYRLMNYFYVVLFFRYSDQNMATSDPKKVHRWETGYEKTWSIITSYIDEKEEEKPIEKFLEEEYPLRVEDKDKYTSRVNNIDYLDDGTHFVGRQQKLGVQNNYNIPIIQKKLRYS